MWRGAGCPGAWCCSRADPLTPPGSLGLPVRPHLVLRGQGRAPGAGGCWGPQACGVCGRGPGPAKGSAGDGPETLTTPERPGGSRSATRPAAPPLRLRLGPALHAVLGCPEPGRPPAHTPEEAAQRPRAAAPAHDGFRATAVQGLLLGSQPAAFPSPGNRTQAGRLLRRSVRLWGPWGGVRGHGRRGASGPASEIRVLPQVSPSPAGTVERSGGKGGP